MEEPEALLKRKTKCFNYDTLAKTKNKFTTSKI
jgi:hypothetical protein